MKEEGKKQAASSQLAFQPLEYTYSWTDLCIVICLLYTLKLSSSAEQLGFSYRKRFLGRVTKISQHNACDVEHMTATKLEIGNMWLA